MENGGMRTVFFGVFVTTILCVLYILFLFYSLFLLVWMWVGVVHTWGGRLPRPTINHVTLSRGAATAILQDHRAHGLYCLKEQLGAEASIWEGECLNEVGMELEMFAVACSSMVELKAHGGVESSWW